MTRSMYYPTKNKYGNVKTEYDGFTFDSKKEAARYAELKMLEKAGAIRGLERQVVFELQPGFRGKDRKWIKPITYVADFVYVRDGEKIIEDVKSPATRKDAAYRLKKKMMAFREWYISEV